MSRKTLADQMVARGLASETPRQRSDRLRREREARDAARSGEFRRAPPPFETPAKLSTAPSASVPLAYDERICVHCGVIYHSRMMATVDLCIPCNGGEVRRVTGEMVWIHKTAPVLEIHGRGPAMTPSEYEASRRR